MKTKIFLQKILQRTILPFAIMLVTTSAAWAQYQITFTNGQNYSSNISMGSSYYFLEVPSGFTATVSGVISGTNQIYKTGAGKLILTGANNFIGIINVTGGTLQIGNGVSTTASINSAASVAVSSGAVLRFEPGADMEFSRPITGTGGRVEYYANNVNGKILFLTANNAYTGTTTIEAGRLCIGLNTSTGSIAGDIVINSGWLQIYRSNDYTYSGVISGAGGVWQHGSTSKITLNGTNTYTGETWIPWGTLALGASGHIMYSSAVRLDGGGDNPKFDISAGGKTIKNLNGSNATAEVVLGTSRLTIGGVTVGDGGGTYAGKISGNGSSYVVDKYGTGTLTLTGTSTYTGQTDINGGVVVFNSLNNFGSSTVRMYGGTLRWASGNTADISGRVNINSNAIFDIGSNNVTFASVIPTTASTITKAGSGRLTITGNQTYTGTTTISEGTLQIGNNTTAGAIAGNITNNSALVFYRSNDVTYSGIISGTGSVTKQGAGVLYLTNLNNSYTGATTISGGTLCLGNYQQTNGNLTGTSSVAVNSGCGFNFDLVSGTTITFARPITGSGSIYKSNTSGKVILTGSNSYSGGMYIHGGVVQVGNGVSGSFSGTVDMNVNGTLRFEPGAATTFGGLISGAGRVEYKGDATKILRFTANNTYSGTTTIESNSHLYLGNNTTAGAIAGNISNNGVLYFNRSNDYTYSGIISGSGGVTKQQSSKTILTGANSYTGATTVSAGALQIGNGTNNTAGIGSTSAVSLSTTNSILRFETTESYWFWRPISGSGRVEYKGGHFLVFTANNSYTGTTSIEQGCLMIGWENSQSNVTGNIINNGAVCFNNPNNYTYSGVISGNGYVYKENRDNTLTLNGANTYTGDTNIHGGILILGTNGSIETSNVVQLFSDNAKLNISAGNKRIKGLNSSYSGSEVVLGGSRLTFGTSGQNDGYGSFSGRITGTGGITKYGTSELYLFGANAFTGNTIIENSRINISGTHASNIVVNGDFVVFSHSTTPTTYSGVISGPGNVGKFGDAALTLNAANTFTGACHFYGPIVLGQNGSIENSSAIHLINSNAKLDISAGNKRIKNLHGAVGSEVILGSSTLTMGTLRVDDGGGTFSGVISGTGSLEKQGLDTFILTGANTYEGSTTVGQGVLQIGDGTNTASSINTTSGVSVTRAVLRFEPGAAMTFSKVISGNGNVEYSGSDTKQLTLSALHTATGSFTHQSGTVNFSGRWAGDYIKADGTTLTVNGNMSVGGKLTLNGGAINMNLSAATPSKIEVADDADVNGSNVMNITSIGAADSYEMIKAAAGLIASDFTLSGSADGYNIYANGAQLMLTNLMGPAAPGNFTASPDNEQVTLAWKTPDDNGSAIRNYQVSYGVAEGYATNWEEMEDSDATTVSYTVTGLSNGIDYMFEVRAVNAILGEFLREGASSGTQTATPATTPSAPGNFTVEAGDTKAMLAWETPNDDGGSVITKYQVSYGATDGYMVDWKDMDDSDSETMSYTVKGLTNGTEYTFEVRAVNIMGVGATSGVQTTTPEDAEAPMAPGSFTAEFEDAEVTLTWTTPYDNRSPIEKYQVSYGATASYTVNWQDIHGSNATTESHTVTGLTNDMEYTFEVRAVNAVGGGASSGIQTATPKAPTVPAAPGNFTAKIGDGEVTLSWTTPNDGRRPITGYQISYSATTVYTANWDDIEESDVTTVSYTVTGLTNGTGYTFEVRAVNIVGEGATSGARTATPRDPEEPAAPDNFAATPGNGQVTLAWETPDDGRSPITGYQVSYGATTGYSANWRDMDDSDAMTVNYIVTGLTNGTGYTFEIRAVNVVGVGASSVTRRATPVTTPTAPGSFIAKTGNEEISLEWTPPNNGGSAITGYQISYGATADYTEEWSIIEGSGTATVRHIVTGLTNGTEYTFEVRAVNSAGEGATSGVQTATPATVPAAPSNFIAEAGDEQVTLSWTTPDDGGNAITGYQISYGFAEDYTANWEDMDDSNAATMSHTIEKLTNDVEYIFEIRAVNDYGEGATSGVQTATPKVPETPSAPGNFTTTAGDGQVTLSWTTPNDNGSPITGYQISYGVKADYTEDWEDIEDSDASTVSYTVMGLTNGMIYAFEVRAMNLLGEGATSGVQTATPEAPEAPSAPGNFTATAGNEQVTLSWITPNDNRSTITKYQVSYGFTKNYTANWVDIENSDAATVSHTVAPLTNGTEYTFELRAVNAVGEGATSDVQTATPATIPAAPGNFTVVADNALAMLAWITPDNGGSQITKYQLSYGVTAGYTADWKEIENSDDATVSHIVAGLTNGTDYTFELRAVNDMGEGTSSGTQTAKPETTPTAPGNFTVSAENAQVTLSWTTPDNGGSAIIGYQISYGEATSYETDWADMEESDAATVSYTVTELTNGTEYTFEIRAVNAVGEGATSGARTAMPATMPSAPENFTATGGNTRVILTWETPDDGGSQITKYQISYGVASNYTENWTDIAGSDATTENHAIERLSNDLNYTFEVRAVNIMGAGASSGVRSTTPMAPPAMPGSFAATAGNAQVILTWSTPDNGGSAIEKYQLSYGATADYEENWTDIAGSGALTRNFIVTNLTNGTEYTFEIRAVSAAGAGATSVARTATPSAPATIPAAPDNFIATPRNAQVILTWTTPDDGGSSIKNYQISYGATAGYTADWRDIGDSNDTTEEYTVTGLNNGTSYTFEVRAANAVGVGASSGTRAATPTAVATAPAVPGSFTTTPGDAQVRISWTAPYNGGSPITGYQVSYGVTAGYTANWSDMGETEISALSYIITGLTNGTSYTFEIRAVNAVGTGTSTGTRTATPSATASVPAAPGSFTATAGNAQVMLTWTTPDNGGSPIEKYQISYGATAGYMVNWSDISGSGATTVDYTVTGLTNGTNYTFEIRAVNAAGPGASSGTQTATPSAVASAPAAPGSFTAAAGDAQVTLTWTTPNNGGSPIMKYQISYGAMASYTTNWSDISGSGAATVNHTITGLTNGTGYTFEVRAVNAVGAGASSGMQTATPAAAATVPAAPDNFIATAGDVQVMLSWTTPNNGGSPITKYQISYGATAGYMANWSDINGSGAVTVSHTVTGLTNGTSYTFEIRAVNTVGVGASTGTQTATPTATGVAPVITTTSLSNGKVGEAYSQTLAATGDDPKTWSVVEGALPGGLNLSPAGVISGTPTSAGTFNFKVQAANNAGVGDKAFSIVISPATVTGSEEHTLANSLKAWAHNGLIHITGLTVGKTLSIYAASGALVYQSVVLADEADIPLKDQGVYIILHGNQTLKVSL